MRWDTLLFVGKRTDKHEVLLREMKLGSEDYDTGLMVCSRIVIRAM